MDEYAVCVPASSLMRASSLAHSYGYQANTRIRLVLTIALSDTMIRDLDVKAVRDGIQQSKGGAEAQADIQSDTHRLRRHRLQPFLLARIDQVHHHQQALRFCPRFYRRRSQRLTAMM